MSVEKKASFTAQSPAPDDRDQTPSPTRLRHRPSMRNSIYQSKEVDGLKRRNSLFSEAWSDTHKSFRTSTDDLLLPRVSTTSAVDDQIETSNWHSVPLVLALLPAVGGLLFKDGSALITDVTLLGLAAIFLNWALRLPWEWYKAAQATIAFEESPQSSFVTIDEEDDEGIETEINGDTTTNGDSPQVRATANVENSDEEEIVSAQRELRIHELLALVACFVFPCGGAWLLHAIRSQLSRPSEGLVSNYNLTIFLLVAEIRPLSHLIKLIQRRTLFLQRKVNTKILREQQVEEKRDLTEMAKRLEELEAHVAESAIASPAGSATISADTDMIVAKAASQASADLRKAFQPELDALNRAMRRYEKRMTITALQVESRLQDLETRIKDVVVLAAAAQRSAEKQPKSYVSTLLNWLSALVVVPTRYAYWVLSLPGKVAQHVLNWLKRLVGRTRKAAIRDDKAMQRSSMPRARGSSKKGKGTA